MTSQILWFRQITFNLSMLYLSILSISMVLSFPVELVLSERLISLVDLFMYSFFQLNLCTILVINSLSSLLTIESQFLIISFGSHFLNSLLTMKLSSIMNTKEYKSKVSKHENYRFAEECREPYTSNDEDSTFNSDLANLSNLYIQQNEKITLSIINKKGGIFIPPFLFY